MVVSSPVFPFFLFSFFFPVLSLQFNEKKNAARHFTENLGVKLGVKSLKSSFLWREIYRLLTDQALLQRVVVIKETITYKNKCVNINL